MKNYTSSNEAQQKQSQFSNLVFNTVEGVAADGIEFGGNYKNESDRVLVKAVFFPGGTKLGLESLKTFFNEAAMLTLMALYMRERNETSELDLETRLYYYNQKCTCYHALYIAEMIDGKSHKEAVEHVHARLKASGFRMKKKELEEILASDITLI